MGRIKAHDRRYASCFTTNEERKGKKVACTRDRKRGAEWSKKSINFMLFDFFTLFYDNENCEYNHCKCHIS